MGQLSSFGQTQEQQTQHLKIFECGHIGSNYTIDTKQWAVVGEKVFNNYIFPGSNDWPVTNHYLIGLNFRHTNE